LVDHVTPTGTRFATPVTVYKDNLLI